MNGVLTLGTENFKILILKGFEDIEDLKRLDIFKLNFKGHLHVRFVVQFCSLLGDRD
jgi:hypothetical protein